MMEEIALEYFRNLSKAEKKRLIRKIFAALTEEEKLELATMITKTK